MLSLNQKNMKIIIKATNLELNGDLRKWIREKLEPLEKFEKNFFKEEKYYDHFFGKGKPRIEMWLEISKTTEHHRKGKIFRAEAQLRFPGKSIRAEATSENLRLAINEVKDKLQREFKQYSERMLSLTKRRQRVSKKILKLDPETRFKRKKGGRTREEGI